MAKEGRYVHRFANELQQRDATRCLLQDVRQVLRVCQTRPQAHKFALNATGQLQTETKQERNARIQHVCKGIKQHNTTTIWKRIEVVFSRA